MINFTRAFGTAWERMVVLLFQPFDLGKWFVIGFCAFLAGLIAGGNGITGSFRGNFDPSNLKNGKYEFHTYSNGTQSLNDYSAQVAHVFAAMAFGVIVAIAVAAVVFVIALTLLFFWLGARGQFMFIDNLVRNRGAVGEPWRRYASAGNSFFGFYLLLTLVNFFILLPFLVIGIVLALPLFRAQQAPTWAVLSPFVILIIAYLIVALVIAIGLFLFREFGIPIMFRTGQSARAAFFSTVNLVSTQPGNVALFILMRIAIFIATAVICTLACCFTCCCLYQIPYLGTVIILPVVVFTRCFTLDCLAQMVPAYDVFAVDVPMAPIPPVSPPPPLG